MKRPLVVLAAGCVLGEVLALQDKTAVDIGFLAWLCAAAAGILWLWKIGTGITCPGSSKAKMQGRSKRRYRMLLLFLSCMLTGGSAGMVRGLTVKGILDREEVLAGQMTGARIAATGKISRIERKEGAVTLTLEEVTAEAGKKDAAFRRMMVYMKEEAGGIGMNHSERTADDSGALSVGLIVRVRGSLTPVEGPRNPGEFDFRIYYRTKGIACRMFGEKISVVGGATVPYYKGLADFRAWCGRVLEGVCVPEDAAVFKAVLLGDTSSMEPELREMYQRNGISHLLAVSGQHLAIIGGGIYLVLRRTGLGYGKAGGISSVLVISYGILTGSSGSAERAVIMTLCLYLAAVKGRSYDTLSALGLAAIILLYREPYLLYHSGFELSFGAVLAIGGLGGWMQSFLGLKRAWEKTLLISLCVQIILTPIVLYHYFQYPLYGIILNLLVIPLVSVLMYSGIAGIILGSFWHQAGVMAVGAGHYILRFYELLCGYAKCLPGYSLVMGRPSWIQIGLYGIGTAAALTGIRLGFVHYYRRNEDQNQVHGKKHDKKYDKKHGKYKNSGNSEKSEKSAFLLLLFCVYALCFLVLLPIPVNGLETVCLDVGQGDGLLLLTRDRVVLVDGGSSSQKNLGDTVLKPFLMSRGIAWIDYAVVSHGDSDHISGLVELMEEPGEIGIGTLILPVMGEGQEVYQKLEFLARKENTEVIYMKAEDQIEAGELTVTCLYAGQDFKDKDRNSHSLILCGDYKGFHMLFTGDTGQEQEKSLLRLAEQKGSVQDTHLNHAQVLKAAHHGSKTSSSEVFLQRLNAKLAVISYGRGNSYGHPSPEVMTRLKEHGIAVLETGINGAVTLKTDGRILRIVKFIEEKSR